MNTAQIRWKRKAAKQVMKLSREAQEQVGAAVDTELPDWRSSPNVKRLTKHQYPYRLRAGDYRVLFSVESGDITILWIEEVRKRDERTY